MGNFWKGRKSKKMLKCIFDIDRHYIDKFVSKTVRWKRPLPADTGYAHNKYIK